MTNVSKANICEYRGNEIPQGEELGLEPNKLYRLLREPKELEKAAPTCNNIQLMRRHTSTTADDCKQMDCVGTFGTDANFEFPYLRNSIAVWDGNAIAGIECEIQEEISMGYHYRADMTPGEFRGKQYDGVMRDIVFNHGALVERGRAGPDVVVGDSALNRSSYMAVISRTGALGVAATKTYLKERLANDSALASVGGVFAGVTKRNWVSERPRILQTIKALVKPHLAQDASIESLEAVLSMLDPDVVDGQDEEETEEEKRKRLAAADRKGKDADPEETEEEKRKRLAAEAEDRKGKDADPDTFLKGKLSAEDMKAYDALRGAKDAAPPMKPAEDKKAMDAAIKMAHDSAIAGAQAIREAERIVRPLLGDISAPVKSAAEVYRMALDAAEVDLEGVHESAYPALVKMAISGRSKKDDMALDAAPSKDFETRFKNVGRISHAA